MFIFSPSLGYYFIIYSNETPGLVIAGLKILTRILTYAEARQRTACREIAVIGVISIWELSLPWLKKAAGGHFIPRNER